MAPILVAGGSGMVGRALVDALHRAGKTVRAVSFSQPIGPSALAGVEWVRADLRVREECRQALRGCDAAIMAAAVTGGSAASRNEPWDQVTDNLVMGAQFLHACHEEGVKRVLLIGSATCYPPAEGLIGEDAFDWNSIPSPPTSASAGSPAPSKRWPALA